MATPDHHDHHDHHDHNDHHDHHDHQEHREHAGHDHGHHHHADPARAGRAFFLAIVLNTGFVIAEFVYGFVANSAALIADAGHNLSDVLGLALAWGAARLARRQPNDRYTWGMGGSTILAALGNAALLFMACGAIAWEALQRLHAPPSVASNTIIWVAAIGIVINAASAWLFARDRKEDINVQGAYLHLAADAAVSAGVVITGLIIAKTQWWILDPIVSLLIVAVIVWSSWGLLAEAVRLALKAVPRGINLRAIDAHLRTWPGVRDVHDLHVWGLSTTESALSAHLVMDASVDHDSAIEAIVRSLKERFAVHHSTLQIEHGNTLHPCPLHPAAAS